MQFKHSNKGKIIFFLLILMGIFPLLLEISFSMNKQESKRSSIFSKIEIISPPSSLELPVATVKPEPTKAPPTNNVSLSDCARIFRNKKAMVVGDSMAEGLSAYGVLDSSNVVWTRGRRIDTMKEDMPKVIEYQPKYLFLSYGGNDLEMWEGDVTSFIKNYKKTLQFIKSALPDTMIIVNSVLPVSEKALEKQPAFGYQELFNAELKKMAEELQIPFLENSLYLLEKENPYTTDGIHPKAFFFEKWGKHMATFLNTTK